MFYGQSVRKIVSILSAGIMVLCFSQGTAAGWGFSYPTGSWGGSSTIKYTCECAGKNELTEGVSSDTSYTNANCTCDGPAYGACTLDLTWTGALVQCTQAGNDAIVKWTASCDGAGDSWDVTGTLTCENGFTDLLGFEDNNPARGCRFAYGRNATVLDTEVVIADASCDDPNLYGTDIASLTVKSLSETSNNVCHSEGTDEIDCGTRQDPTTGTGDGDNTLATTCRVNPTKVNIDCESGKGGNDNGGMNVCLLSESGVSGYSSFDATNLDGSTATMNGYSATSWLVDDCDGDGLYDDFKARFPTCVKVPGPGNVRENTVQLDGRVYMQTNFSGEDGSVNCTEFVETN